MVGKELSKKKGRWKFFFAFLMIFAPAVGAIWFLQATSELRWARVQLPRIMELAEQDELFPAFELAVLAEEHLPEDPTLVRFFRDFTLEISVETTPPSADVYIGEYGTPDEEWMYAGKASLAQVRVPRGVLEYKVLKEGFATARGAMNHWFRSKLSVSLDEEEILPTGMVRVAGDALFSLAEYGNPGPLEDYWIDRYEVTNKQFKGFVDSGGYENSDYWKHDFVKGTRVLSWEEAMLELVDDTGQPGPANWELGGYPDGEDDYPVTGVSWYEAAAYGEYAGKVLPTIYHWNKAAGPWMSEAVVPNSNFGRGPAPVGSHHGMSPYGSFDMAGNVREWCSNRDTQGRRFILGAGWNDAAYSFPTTSASDPFNRSPTNGFRCMSYIEKPKNLARLADPVEFVYRDYRAEQPVSDEIFAVYNSLYRYDETEFDAKLESEEATDDWIKQTVSFEAAYGDERMLAHVFLPRNGVPPFQVVAFFPGSDAFRRSSSDFIDTARFEFLMTSGRAVLFPIYKGTYERADDMRLKSGPDKTTFYKEHIIMWSKDLGRSIDYVETREDMDTSKLAYYGVSVGGGIGPILMAVEERLTAGVLPAAGFWFQKVQPEADQINFVSRVTVPVLMLNGRYDFIFPLETSQEPFFELLGTLPEHKKMLVYDRGHSVPRTELIKETLDWLDRYLGPVR